MSTVSAPLHVASVPLTPDSHALQLALRAWSQADRGALLQSLTDAPPASTSPLVLIEARRGAVLAGAVLGQCMPGRSAIVWAPQLVEPQPLVTSSSLLDELCRELAARDIVMAQSLLHSEALLDAEHFQAGGFSRLADLLYMHATPDVFPGAQPTMPFELQPVKPGDEARLVQTIDRTYIDTLDCPRLDGSRATADVVESYKAIGIFRPELWHIASYEGRDVGCLVLADHPLQQNVELVYMGITPEARGQGFGSPLVRMAQWLTKQIGRERLVLAVDIANRPAVQLYESAGFRVFDQRSVYWKQIRSAAQAEAASAATE